MSRKRLGMLMAAVLAVGIVSEAWWHLPRIGDQPFPADYAKDGRSGDLPADIKLMWETEPLTGNAGPHAGPNPRSSTDRAIHAASRVFATTGLAGKTRAEVIALLGDPRVSNDSIYNFPFHDAPWGALVYRFDTGSYGWQFNVRFNWWGTVRRVDRLWIH
ncbi:hypothetical protein J0H58_04830 [bacterium]|nr:hypothetical protein [bacterium]